MRKAEASTEPARPDDFEKSRPCSIRSEQSSDAPPGNDFIPFHTINLPSSQSPKGDGADPDSDNAG